MEAPAGPGLAKRAFATAWTTHERRTAGTRVGLASSLLSTSPLGLTERRSVSVLGAAAVAHARIWGSTAAIARSAFILRRARGVASGRLVFAALSDASSTSRSRPDDAALCELVPVWIWARPRS